MGVAFPHCLRQQGSPRVSIKYLRDFTVSVTVTSLGTTVTEDSEVGSGLSSLSKIAGRSKSKY